MSQRLSRETELKRSVSESESRLSRAGETVLKGVVSESKSRLPCAGETELKSLVPERAGITALEGAVKASRWVRATASESVGIIGLRHVSKSQFDSLFVPSIDSSMGVDLSACARVAASASCSSTSPALLFSASAAYASVSPLLSNSWSDTVHHSRCAGGCCLCANPPVAPWGLAVRVPGEGGAPKVVFPVRRKICVLSQRWRQGVNFRPAGGVRGQVAGSIPRKQPGTGSRRFRVGVDTPSLHPEVPGIQFVSPGRGLDIRQLMGWTNVCETARSGICALKGIARACMLPENLDHLRVGWISRATYETAWVTPGHDCLCSYKYGHGAAVRPQTNDAIWDGVIGLWGRVAAFLSPWCGKKDVLTGVNLNQYAGSGSFILWHSDNKPLFGPQNLPKLMVSLSLGNSVSSRCVVARRVMFPLRFGWTMVRSWSWMV